MNKVLFSSQKDNWSTPIDLFNELDQEFNFTLDPCADEFNHKCKKYFTLEDNGLLKDWSNDIVFCNPPYGRKIYDWVKKAYYESKKGALVVLLIPSRTDTKYFHEFLYNKSNVELRFLKGRLKFGESNNYAPFPSLIAILRVKHEKI